MRKRVLITGGAGFVGSHVADELLRHGYAVRALDNLTIQVHGSEARRPEYLHGDVELLIGDIRDPEAVRLAMDGVDVVCHFAAAVGVGQSMYQVAKYTSVNTLGTAVLLEALIQRPVERLVVASSRNIYGEGMYRGRNGATFANVARSYEQLQDGNWEVHADGEPLEPIPTPEGKPPMLTSVYAMSKYDQERMCMIVARAYNMQAVVLRLFNVYGPRQALGNPHAGVMAIFASRLLSDRPPMIFEDGCQQRDFVCVHDVAQAARLAVEAPQAAGGVFNVGSGQRFTINEVAERLARALGKDIEAEVTGQCRMGDIRHCFADISLAQSVLGYRPRVTLDRGMAELAGWLEGQFAHDRAAEVRDDLNARGLTV